MHTLSSKEKLYSYLGQTLYYTGYVGAGITLAIFLVGFVPQMEGPEVRRLISKDVREMRPEDYPRPIVANGNWSVRSEVSKRIRQFKTEPTTQKNSADTWLQFHPQGISLNTAGGVSLQKAVTSLALVLAYDNQSMLANMPHRNTATQPGLLSVQLPQNGEALNQHGKPLRWTQISKKTEEISFDAMCNLAPLSIDALQSALQAKAYRNYGIPRGGGSVLERAGRYKEIIAKASQQFGIRESLIYAIIQTESNFYPHVTSPARAMGLMQLLPGTANTMHKYVYGRAAQLSFDQITNPEMNITLGVAFVKLMMTNYFSAITDVKTREYCTIASYNMGPGRLFPFFGSSKAEAIANINAMTPHDVFERLVTGLPYRETRAYLSHVNARDHQFSNF